MPKMDVATTSIMEAQYEPKMPWRQRVVKPPRRPHRVERRRVRKWPSAASKAIRNFEMNRRPRESG